MANQVELHPLTQWMLSGISASIRALAQTAAAEHALALRAAGKAALPRQRMAEVRAMYLPTDRAD